jgi:hypothetical protein
MSVWSDIKRAMRPAEMTEREFGALRYSFEKSIAGAEIPPEGVRIEAPGVSHAGKPYLLVLILLATGKISRFEVDHHPDLSSPAFDAYTDFRNDPSRGERTKLPAATLDAGEGEGR